jgi:hypothetical protein
MARLGEEVIIEWLNRDGYFTMRSVMVGSSEIDVLAIRPLAGGGHDCRHIEVQLSPHPMSYIAAGSMGAKKKTEDELRAAVKEWVDKKFNRPNVVKLRESLCPDEWTKELVLWNVKYRNEVDEIERLGIKVWWLKNILDEMVQHNVAGRYSAAGRDLLALMIDISKEAR